MYFCAANRTGLEKESTRFVGSSCVMKVQPPEEPIVMSSLGVEEEATLVETIII